MNSEGDEMDFVYDPGEMPGRNHHDGSWQNQFIMLLSDSAGLQSTSSNFYQNNNAFEPMYQEFVPESGMILPDKDPIVDVTYAAVDCNTNWVTSSTKDPIACDVGVTMDVEVMPMSRQFGVNQLDVIYPAMLPNNDFHRTSPLESETMENIQYFDLTDEHGRQNFVVPSVPAPPSEASSETSGISSGTPPSQSSDDAYYSQDFKDVNDEGVCSDIFYGSPDVEEIAEIHHEEIISTNQESENKHVQILKQYSGGNKLREEEKTESALTLMKSGIFATKLYEGDECFDEVDGGHLLQENDVFEQKLKYITYPVTQAPSVKFYEECESSSSEEEWQPETIDPDWSVKLGLDWNAPRKKRAYRRRKPVSKPVKSNSEKSLKSSKPTKSVIQTRIKKKQSKMSDRNTKKVKSVSKRRDLESVDDQSKPFPVRRNDARKTAKCDITSFRFKVGPHLRALSAVLDLSGIKLDSDSVPYEVIRRFHPTDMYRTIEKSINNISNWKSPTEAVEPDWEFVGSYDDPISWVTGDQDKNVAKRIFYKSPFGTADPHHCFSVRQELEENGKLIDSPEVLTAIGSAELNASLNLRIIAEKCVNTELKETTDNIGPLLMRLKEPKSTGLLYESGKILVMGTNSFEEFRTAVRKFARMVQKTGVNVKLNSLKLHYCVGMIKLPFKINVEAMMKHEYLSQYILFDASLFTGVVFRMNDSPILTLVFENGAIIMTNSSGAEEMKNVIDKMYPRFRLFGFQC